MHTRDEGEKKGSKYPNPSCWDRRPSSLPATAHPISISISIPKPKPAPSSHPRLRQPPFLILRTPKRSLRVVWASGRDVEDEKRTETVVTESESGREKAEDAGHLLFLPPLHITRSPPPPPLLPPPPPTAAFILSFLHSPFHLSSSSSHFFHSDPLLIYLPARLHAGLPRPSFHPRRVKVSESV